MTVADAALASPSVSTSAALASAHNPRRTLSSFRMAASPSLTNEAPPVPDVDWDRHRPEEANKGNKSGTRGLQIEQASCAGGTLVFNGSTRGCKDSRHRPTAIDTRPVRLCDAPGPAGT